MTEEQAATLVTMSGVQVGLLFAIWMQGMFARYG